MPKPMLKEPQTCGKTSELLSATNRNVTQNENVVVNKMKMDRLLRKRRSPDYMAMLHKLDAGGHVNNRNKVNEIIETIRNEFPEVDINGVLLGYVSKCYLGDPYEVHTLDVSGEIIEHYKRGQGLLAGMEKARSIALRGGYEFIEVYIDCCRAVSADGTVSVIWD